MTELSLDFADLKDWLLKQHQKALLDGVEMGNTYTKARIIKELQRRISEHDPELTGTGPCACLGYEAVIEWLEDEGK